MKAEEIKLALKKVSDVQIQFAGVQDIFESVKESKSQVSAIGTDMSSASSKIGSAKNKYASAKKLAEAFLVDLKTLDPDLLNTPQGKGTQRWLVEIDTDMKTLMSLQSDISKIGSITSKFKL
jgi:hypothetical protein